MCVCVCVWVRVGLGVWDIWGCEGDLYFVCSGILFDTNNLPELVVEATRVGA